MLYAVIYDLKNEEKDYSMLYKKLTEYEPWMHYIETLWMIESKKNASEIVNELLPLIDKETDFILVIGVTREHQGLLPKEAWDWITENEQKRRKIEREEAEEDIPREAYGMKGIHVAEDADGTVETPPKEAERR